MAQIIINFIYQFYQPIVNDIRVDKIDFEHRSKHVTPANQVYEMYLKLLLGRKALFGRIIIQYRS